MTHTADERRQVRYVSTPNWRLRLPEREPVGKVVCIPTVHPCGDQRVLRCAQSLLDAGYGVHFLWMGGEPGSDSWPPWVAETRLRKASGTLDRLLALPVLSALAGRRRPAAWHIHDYYMLPFALLWRTATSRSVIYDVHEYYGPMYASKVARPLRRPTAWLVDAFQAWAARGIGGVNLVAEEMRPTFRRCPEDRVSVTPNLPARDVFGPAPEDTSQGSPQRVIHTGSLSKAYGSHVLIDIARLLAERSSSTQVIAVRRFPSSGAEESFLEEVSAAGSPPNLVLVDPVPVHQVPALLGTCGIGLSLIQDSGQNKLAIPTKLFEYVLAGLVIVGSDLGVQRNFLGCEAVSRLVEPANVAGYVSAIEDLQHNWDRVASQARSRALQARDQLTWETSCSPRLQTLAKTVVG